MCIRDSTIETQIVLVQKSGQRVYSLVSKNDCFELFHQKGKKGDGKRYQNHE